MLFRFLKKVNKHFILAPNSDKALYLSALRWAFVVRFSMVFLPFKFYRPLFGKMQTVAQQDPTPEQLKEALHVRTIVLSICNNTFWESKCMVQALACKQILQKKGIETTIYLGVRTKAENKKMEAHAWLKLKDHFLTGKKGHLQFKVVNFYS